MSEDSPREENERCRRCAARSGPTISTPDSSKPADLVSAEVTQAATLRAPLNHELRQRFLLRSGVRAAPPVADTARNLEVSKTGLIVNAPCCEYGQTFT